MTTEGPIPSAPPQSSDSLWNKMIRAARLDINLYEEVEHDTGATGQAFVVVLLVSLATGIGMGIGYVIEGEESYAFLRGLGIGLGSGIVGWLLWSLFAYVLGTTIFRGPETEATYGQLLRTLGFANTPGFLRIFSFVPFFGGLIALAGFIWLLIAGVIAVRQALDFSTWRAIGTCVVGWLLYLLLTILVGVFVGGILFWF